jgi:hypothetical protein
LTGVESRGKAKTAAVDDGSSRTSYDQQPLIGAAMAVLRATFGFARHQHHLGGL